MLATRLLIGFALTLEALVAGTSDPVPNVIVYPTGVYPADHHNVQAAVNQGGVVLLKAVDTAGHPLAFNFGPPVAGSGRVFLFNRNSEVEPQLSQNRFLTGAARKFAVFPSRAR